MIKHIIVWTLQDKCFGPNLDTIKTNITNRLESVNGQIPGLKDLEVHAVCLSSSNADIVLEAVLEDEKAMKDFKNNELWKNATKDVVVPFVDTTTHIEYEL